MRGLARLVVLALLGACSQPVEPKVHYVESERLGGGAIEIRNSVVSNACKVYQRPDDAGHILTTFNCEPSSPMPDIPPPTPRTH